MLFLSQPYTTKAMTGVIAELSIEEKRIIIPKRAKRRKFHPIACVTLVLLFTLEAGFIGVVTVLHAEILEAIFHILTIYHFKTIKSIF